MADSKPKTYESSAKSIVAGGTFLSIALATALHDIQSLSISGLSVITYIVAVVGGKWAYEGILEAHDKARGR